MVKKNTKDDRKVFAFLAVFLSIIGFVVALLVKRDDKYVMFYAKESLVLFLAYVLVYVLTSILVVVTFGIASVLLAIVWIPFVILWIIQLVNSLSGKMIETPLIGEYSKKIKL